MQGCLKLQASCVIQSHMQGTPACSDNACGAQHCLQHPRLRLHRWACLQRRYAHSLGLRLPNGILQPLLQRLCRLSLCPA